MKYYSARRTKKNPIDVSDRHDTQLENHGLEERQTNEKKKNQEAAKH